MVNGGTAVSSVKTGETAVIHLVIFSPCLLQNANDVNGGLKT